jgi:tyrosyl-tRNA synthetase
MAKDSVKKRLEGDTGMSFTEFSYQLVQGYDFYYLWKERNCLVQMGGSDQWGNMVTGTELIRRKAGGTAFAITTQLIKKADGTKFGKTEEGAVWLDAKRTSPFDFYKFWFNASDDDAKTWIRIFTLKTQAEIEGLETAHNEAPHLRILQKALAEDITKMVHGPQELEMIQIANRFIYDPNYTWEELSSLTEEQFLSVFSSTNVYFISPLDVIESFLQNDILNFLVEIKNYDESGNWKAMFESKSEAKKLILNGGVYINKVKISLEDKISDYSRFLDKYIFVQKGKKNSALVDFCNDVTNEQQRMRRLMNKNTL